VPTPKGLRDIFVLVFLDLETRRVFITPASYKPDAVWMRKQATAFVRHVKDNQAGRESYVVGEPDEITGEDVLPEFRRPVADLFRLPGESASG
jgi:hypothetical protein